MNLNQKQLEALSAIASKKLGTTPQALEQELKKGTFDRALEGMPKPQAAMLQQALANPKIAEQILSSPQAKEIFKKLVGGK